MPLHRERGALDVVHVQDRIGFNASRDDRLPTRLSVLAKRDKVSADVDAEFFACLSDSDARSSSPSSTNPLGIDHARKLRSSPNAFQRVGMPAVIDNLRPLRLSDATLSTRALHYPLRPCARTNWSSVIWKWSSRICRLRRLDLK